MTAFDLAQRYVGIKELAGKDHHPLIQWWLMLCSMGHDSPDETPWCSAFMNGVAWELRLPRSKSAAARSWLTVGQTVRLDDAEVGDVVVLQRGTGKQPGADVLSAPGHVGLFAGRDDTGIQILGGNQSNGVCVQTFDKRTVLGVRRLAA